MRILAIGIGVSLGLFLMCAGVYGTVWEELFDRAESLAAAGELDSADVVVDAAMSRALSTYGESDTTVKIKSFWGGIPEYHYFRTPADAESMYARVVSLKERIFGAESPQAASALYDLADFHLYQEQDSLAAALHERALAIREAALGPDHLDVARSLRGLGSICALQGRYDAAEEALRRSLSSLEEALGPEHPEVALCLRWLCLLQWWQGLYFEAEEYCSLACGIWEESLGSDHPYMRECILSLGSLNQIQGEYAEAESLYKRVLVLTEQALGAEHPDLINTLGDLAWVYLDLGRYSEAEPLFERALAISEKAFGEEHEQVARTLTGLAALYWYQHKLPEAERHFKRALAIYEKIAGPRSWQVSWVLEGLGNTYGYQGRYTEAERVYRRSLAISEKIYGPGSASVAMTLGNLADITRGLGRYAEAESLFNRALAIQEKTLGPSNPHGTENMRMLATLYICQGRFAEAESLATRCLAIREEALGSESTEVGYTLAELAWIHYCRGAYAEAERLYRRALAVLEQSLSGERGELAWVLSSLACVCTARGNYAEAESLHVRAIALEKGSPAPDPNMLADDLEAFSWHCRLTNANGKALGLAREALEIRRQNFRDLSAMMSERDALMYSQFARESANTYLSLYFDIKPRDDSTKYFAADAVFAIKGQASEPLFVRTAKMNMVDHLGRLADSLRQASSVLSDLYVSGRSGEEAPSRESAITRAIRDKERIEDAMAAANTAYHSLQEALDADTKRILDVLSFVPGRTTLVEYMKYDREFLTSDSSVAHYLVLVMDRESLRAVVDLGEASDIDDLVDRYRDHILSVSSAGKLPSGADQVAYRDVSTALYEAVWKPIEDLVDESGLVLIAPDGGLNMVSFAGLTDDEDRYLVERVAIHYLSSGRDLIRLEGGTQPSRGLFALGDPDYYATAFARAKGEAEATAPVVEVAGLATRNVRSGCGELKDVTALPLPGTRKEVELIASTWEASTSEPLTVCLGLEATEERLKSEAPGKRVIHLATHGYFLEGSCLSKPAETRGFRREVTYAGENPLLLSGLFLAGANLHGEGADSLGAEDGILTAEETTAMNLSGTELVVLSACETGLGRVEEGEGVYGLRRAFQMAGARTVISALWPVSDEATANMMGRLYGDRGESIPETMRRIQMARIRALRKEQEPDHPFTWGGFIAMGDWR